MQYDDHLTVTRLEDGVFDVVVKNVHFITADRRETKTCVGEEEREGEGFPVLKTTFPRFGHPRFPAFPLTAVLTISMSLQRALHPLLSDVGSDVEVFEFGVAAVEVDDQRVLLDDALLLLLFGLSCFVALLHLLDDAEGVLQVGGGHRCVAGSLQVGRPVRAERQAKERKGSLEHLLLQTHRVTCQGVSREIYMHADRKTHISLTNVASGLGKMFPSCRPSELPGT